MSRYGDSSLASGLGRRRRIHRRTGRGILSDVISSFGLGRRRRRVHRRVRRGRGILDIIKKVIPFVKNSGVVSHLAGMIPGVGSIAGPVAKAVGWGRRRHRRVRRRIGGKRRVRRGIRM